LDVVVAIGNNIQRPSDHIPPNVSSEIARFPVTGSFGDALVISSFSFVVVTGSNVIAVGSFETPANVTCCPVTGTHAAPSQ
jgi:hypothetical protein